jgi:catechol 2,3-dioxygenase-like lactoylglutathione lyase family enzyme
LGVAATRVSPGELSATIPIRCIDLETIGAATPYVAFWQQEVFMLLDGFNHVAVVTNDTDRFVEFYTGVFEAEVFGQQHMGEEGQLTFVKIGDDAEFNVFEIFKDPPNPAHTPMLGRGPLDHVGLQAPSLEAFEEIRRRLIERGAADEFVTDFGPVLSMFFTDPDGLEAEVLVKNPDWEPGVFNPPGTPAKRFVTG